MTKLCCIGTSHIGALKSGWEAMAAQWPGVQLAFFGAPNLNANEESIKHLALQGRSIVPTSRDVSYYYRLTSGGQTHIDIDAYDGFIVQGGISITQAINLYTLFRTDEQVHDDENVLISVDCLVESLTELFRTSYAYRLTTALYQLTRKPVFLVADPRPSAGLLASEGSDSEAWEFYIRLIQRMHAGGDHVPAARYYLTAVQAVRQQGVSIVDGPAPLIVDELFTPPEFCKDSVWLQNEKFEVSPRDDFFHMNHHYGAAVLREIFARGGMRPPAA